MSKIYHEFAKFDLIWQELAESLRNKATTNDMQFATKNSAKLVFTQKAWIKIMSLVCVFSTEVQWHGLVERQSDTEWKVTDIVVFPHETYGAAVISEQEEYEEWLNTLDDETFSRLKLHGHSHVNMCVEPSGFYGHIINGNTDESYRARIVSSLPDNKDDSNYYIFVIFNKKEQLSARIYDKKKNLIYDTEHRSIEIAIEGLDLGDFIDEAIAMTQRDKIKQE